MAFYRDSFTFTLSYSRSHFYLRKFEISNKMFWVQLMVYFPLIGTFCIYKDASNIWSIVACVLFAAVTLLAEPLPSNYSGIHIDTQIDVRNL
jgi:hypothetical protein